MSSRKTVMTLMVRDERDIIQDWLEHHLAQGLDRIIVTDNGSVDGTYELLSQYAEAGLLDLETHAAHDKNQYETVTRMARRAHVEHGASWVLNSDADEFWVTRSHGTLAEAVAALPDTRSAYPIPVTNMFGPVHQEGFDIVSAVFADNRTEEELARVGLHAHPTSNLVHPGAADVEIAQGNHFTNQPAAEALPDDIDIQVFHFPMRSWLQYRNRVALSGAAYENNPDLRPSPRHHTKRDFRWHRAGLLEPFFVARHPVASREGFDQENFLAELAAVWRAHPRMDFEDLPATLHGNVDEMLSRHSAFGEAVLAVERELVAAVQDERERHSEIEGRLGAVVQELEELQATQAQTAQALHDAAERLALLGARNEGLVARVDELKTETEAQSAVLERIAGHPVFRVAKTARGVLKRGIRRRG